MGMLPAYPKVRRSAPLPGLEGVRWPGRGEGDGNLRRGSGEGFGGL